MNKKIVISLLSSIILCNATVIVANQNADKLNLAGTYKCTAHDSHDGLIEGIVTYTIDERAGAPDQNFSAYRFTSKEYSGYASAQGNSFAYYFENKNQKDPVALTDHGVGIATVAYEQDNSGKFKTYLHGFYFEPDYQRDAKGGRGNVVCVKLD